MIFTGLTDLPQRELGRLILGGVRSHCRFPQAAAMIFLGKKAAG